ncbi:MAG: cell division protein SepF [Acidimicrobiia bacterium]
MASMWRRAMVYLGLQDDEPDYGGEYESYASYADDDARRGGYDTDDDYGDRPRRDGGGGGGYEPEPEPAVRAASGPERRTVAVSERRGRDEPAAPPAPRPSVVRTIGPTTAARVHIVEPQSFNDAQEVGDRLKANQPVILNLQGLPKELQRRLIDFSSGLAYAVGGQMAKVNDQVFLLKPSDVEVSQEEKERLQARGLYQS